MLVDARSAEIASVPLTIQIPAGTFIRGSDRAEREHAYQLDEAAYGHSVTRKNRWYESEFKRAPVTTNAFAITKTLVTNKQYASFVAATGHRVPDVDRATWKSYGLIHPFSRTLRHAWSEGQPPKGREKHPVVLVSHPDAKAYATWLSEATGDVWRLSTETEWEKAARGLKGRRFPWGETFDPSRLNSHDKGPFDMRWIWSANGACGPDRFQRADPSVSRKALKASSQFCPSNVIIS